MDTHLLMALEIGWWRTVPVSETLLDDGDDIHGFAVRFNRRNLKLSADQWADLLVEMQSRGFIVFQRFATTRTPYALPPLILTRSALLDAVQMPDGFRMPNALYYALTPEGGAFWEQATQADWSQYLSEEEGYSSRWEAVYGGIDHEEEPRDESSENPSGTSIARSDP